eukprot:275229-Prymnesium_polylepis.1
MEACHAAMCAGSSAAGKTRDGGERARWAATMVAAEVWRAARAVVAVLPEQAWAAEAAAAAVRGEEARVV